MSDTPTEFELHACGPEDRVEQAALFNACFKKPIDAAGLAWRYDHNPDGMAISLLARPRDAKTQGVSGYACSPRAALIRGVRSGLVGQTGDVMTHPDWRKRGIFSGLDRRAMASARERGWPMCFGLPNHRSAHIFLELGWSRVGEVRSHELVLVADGAARAERAKHGRLRPWTTAMALARAGRQRARMQREVPKGARVEAIETGFPKDVEALCGRVAAQHALLLSRDAAHLDWRFLRAPSGLHRAFAARDEGGVLRGYAVVQSPRAGAAVGYLVDALGDDPNWLTAAIEAGLKELQQRRASIALATAIVGSPWEQILARHGFVAPRRAPRMGVILHVHDAAHPLSAVAADPRAWYFTDGDRDDETMG